MDLTDIEEYEGIYKFDKNLNQIFNVKTNKYLKNCFNKGYYFVYLYKNGKSQTFRLNHLIYKYNNQDNNQDDLVDIDGYEDDKVDLNLDFF